MARTTTRPKITVQAVYSGDKDMRELFIRLLVDEVQRSKKSVRTFENVKEPEYNLDTGDRKRQESTDKEEN